MNNNNSNVKGFYRDGECCWFYFEPSEAQEETEQLVLDAILDSINEDKDKDKDDNHFQNEVV